MDREEMRVIVTRGNVLRLAVETYGEEAQQSMMIEEMSELTKAICKLKRASSEELADAAIDQIVEEMADVQIMLDQMRLIFGETDEIEREKLSRLLLRIMEGKKGGDGRGKVDN